MRSPTSGQVASAIYEALASRRFWRAYERLPAAVRALADKNFALLRQDQSHPSLRFKRIGKYWSVRVGIRYRALAVEMDGNLVWFWIGSHATTMCSLDELSSGGYSR
jgi:hypothetical protein